jgi:hypothetical protein
MGKPVEKPSNAALKESELHDEIAAHCRSKGWLYFHSRMDKKSTATVGQPDFTILADNGRVLFIEAKAKAGKLSTEQVAVKVWAQKLGHVIHTIFSYEQFVALTTDQKL